MEITKLVQRLCALTVTAGDYALRVQQRVAHQPIKTQYENIFAQALTDADLSVQAFMEVSLLAEFPALAFFGEEVDHSLNMKYFPKKAPYTVYLDPIDGTRYYQDGSDLFNVILTVVKDQKIQAAVVAMPAKDAYYWGIRGKGTYRATRHQVLASEAGEPVTLNTQSRVVLANNLPHVVVGDPWVQTDVVAEYQPGFDKTITDVLTGRARAACGLDAGLIDWGAIAFLVEQAGGCVSDMAGRPLEPINMPGDFRFPDILASTDTQAHEELVAILVGQAH